MKSLKNYIAEKLVINKNYTDGYNYHPKDKDELKAAIQEHYDNEIYNLNDIDVSKIIDFSNLFQNDKKTGNKKFNISDWDVRSGENFISMFNGCTNFNCDLSRWTVNKGIYFDSMFNGCKKFNCDLSKWNVSSGESFSHMFNGCKKFNCDLSKWDVRNGEDFTGMFSECNNFNCDLSYWNVNNGNYFPNMFYNCPIKQEFKPKHQNIK